MWFQDQRKPNLPSPRPGMSAGCRGSFGLGRQLGDGEGEDTATDGDELAEGFGWSFRKYGEDEELLDGRTGLGREWIPDERVVRDFFPCGVGEELS